MRRYLCLLVAALALAAAPLLSQGTDSARPGRLPVAPARAATTRATPPARRAAEPEPLRALAPWIAGGATTLLAVATLLFIALAVRGAGSGGAFGVESHWGGFGGGLGGWRLSPPLVYLVAAFTFGLILAALAAAVLPRPGFTGGKTEAADSAAAR